MGAIGLVFRAEARRRWRSWLSVAILIGVVGGVVLGAAAAGRRTESAFPSFVKTYGFDVVAFSTQPLPALAKMQGVAGETEVFSPANGQPTCDACRRPINPSDLTVGVLSPTNAPVAKLVAGRLPNPSDPDEVVASFNLQQDDGVQVGTVIRVPFYAPSQLAAVAFATGAPPAPRGPTIALRVVGIEASVVDFPSGSTPSYHLLASAAFLQSVVPRTAVFYEYFVRLSSGAAGISRFVGSLNDLGSHVLGYESADVLISAVEQSIHPQAVGWWILAALAALVGLAVVGQAIARQSATESEDYPTLAALGADRRLLVTLSMVRNLIVGVVGAIAAVALAVILSPLAPVGEARLAERSAGIAFDPLVLPLGALAVVAVVIGLGAWPAFRLARAARSVSRSTSAHRSVIASALATVGASPSALIGVRHALQWGSSRASVPVATALVGMVLAVTALCATGVFGSSLSNLNSTPALYGDGFQLNFTDYSPVPDPALVNSLERDPAVTAVTHGLVEQISLDGVSLPAVAETVIRGRPLFSIVAGRMPSGNGQIGLGTATMRQLGVSLSGVVHFSMPSPTGGIRAESFRVVAKVSFPVLGGVTGLGTGAVLTIGSFENALCATGPHEATCRRDALQQSGGGGLLVAVASGPRGVSAVRHYLDSYESITAVPVAPTSLINFGEAVNFPLIFGAMLALFGSATLVHLLAVSVSRRRRETGLLKALGFVRFQVASAVAWQATTLAVIGIVIGVPVGLLVGRSVWNVFAVDFGVVPVSVVPAWLLVALVGGVVMAANLIAVVPAIAASRMNPARLLRSQ